MAFFMITGGFPLHKSDEVGKAFGKLPELPSFVKLVQIYVSTAGRVEFFSLYECEDDKYFEGFKALAKRLAGYRVIEGYEFNIRPVLETKDALALVGLG